jgi:hypothetical protein
MVSLLDPDTGWSYKRNAIDEGERKRNGQGDLLVVSNRSSQAELMNTPL